MSSKVRIGFVGVGSMGQCAHLKHYAAVPDCEVVALAEPRAELARLVAERYRVPHAHPDAGSMLAAESLDAIVAVQPFERHGSIVMPLYKHGIPILTEKPLASTVEISETLLAELKKGGSWHMVGYHKRSDPATVAAKAEIERLKKSGELGPLRYVRIMMPAGDWIAGGFHDLIRTNEQGSTPADPRPPDMDEPMFARYVTFVNYYIHQVNLMRHLLGEAYTVAFADEIVLAIRSKSGVTGVIEMSPYRTETDWHESAMVAFERGYVRLDLPAPLATKSGSVEFFRDRDGHAPETLRPQLSRTSAMSRQAASFVAAVRGEAEPPCEAAEAVEDLKIARDYIRMLRT